MILGFTGLNLNWLSLVFTTRPPPAMEPVHITAEGALISRTNECHIHNTLKAFIPVKWAQPRISDGEAVSEEYIRDFGNRLRNTLWKNTWNKRQDSFREWQEEMPNNHSPGSIEMRCA